MTSRWRAIAAATLLTAAAGGCVNSQARLRQGLTRAGVPAPMADCMSARMVDRLSLAQLRRIGRLEDIREDLVRDGSVDRFLRNIEALGDPEILGVASTSAAVCAVTAP